MIIGKVSTLTGNVNRMDIDVSVEQLSEWYQGELIQVAMPNITDTEREFIISGVTPEEWAEAFGNPDD